MPSIECPHKVQQPYGHLTVQRKGAKIWYQRWTGNRDEGDKEGESLERWRDKQKRRSGMTHIGVIALKALLLKGSKGRAYVILRREIALLVAVMMNEKEKKLPMK
ncbi:hypothetical protein LOAG_00007 [Loa loa]|uniref:Transposase n=1 Tax=Loa loa TaxID=7209 RepID=A0A1I7VUE9_LOALO|nr:hypothetical protein LOAG_00007 [Loa loa]EFO28463.1 hypothetical protein LOAG_00007 [Loa loa]